MKKYTGKNSSHWMGGKHKTKYGYVLIKKPGDPMADVRGYVPEHRLVMSNHINRPLNRNEIVHHINHDKSDNRIDNLMLISKLSDHLKLHWENGSYENRDRAPKC